MNPRQKIYLILSIVFVVVLIVVFAVIMPLINNIKTLSQMLIDEQINIKTSLEEQKQSSGLMNQYQEIEPTLVKFKESLLDPAAALSFIIALENMAEKTNNNYNIQVASRSQEPSADFPFLAFQISLWGNFSNLMKFLSLLENMPYWVEISQVQIQLISSSVFASQKGSVNLSVNDIATNLTIKVYIQK